MQRTRSGLLLAVGATVALLLPLAPAGARPAGNPQPVEEPGADSGNDLGLPPVPARPGATRAVPPTPGFGFGVDDPSIYEPQSTCDPTAKPGTLALRSMLLSAYPGTGDLGITRACDIGDRSEHKEGRAFDWAVDATSPTQKAKADQLIAWLLATDAHGHRFARARRLGIMYIIWNRQIWRSFQDSGIWKPYTGPNPHTNHVHFSLNWAGARKQTSWWTPDATFVPIDGVPIGTRTDFDGDGRDDLFLYGPGSDPDRIRWGAPRGTAEPVTDVAVAGRYRPVAGDFDGNGADDVLWYGPGDAKDYLWPGVPGGRAFGTTIPLTIAGDFRPIAGDFDGNGVDDVVWYGPGPLPDEVWWGTAPGSFAHSASAITVQGVYDASAGDLDGDGADDILWYGRNSLPDSLWLGTVGEQRFRNAAAAATQPYRPFVGDFDGDQRDDVFWYQPAGAFGAVQWGDPTALAGPKTPRTVKGTYIPLVGDRDGDGADDITWYQPGIARDFRWYGSGGRSFTSVADDIPGRYLAF